MPATTVDIRNLEKAAVEAVTEARDALAAVDQEWNAKNRRHNELEASIKAAQDAGDLDAPLRDWSKELRELRGEIEDIVADRERFVAVIEARERELSRVRVDVGRERLGEFTAEVRAIAAAMLQGLEAIRAGVEQLRVRRSPLQDLHAFITVNATRAGVKPGGLPDLGDMTRFEVRLENAFAELVKIADSGYAFKKEH